MSIDQLAAKASKFITDNSPTILTVIGVAGTVTTAFLTGKASYRAAQKIEHEKGRIEYEATSSEDAHFDTKDKLKLVWTLYIPPVTSAGLTVAAIIAANRVGLRRAATMAALYSASEKRIAEYKNKVVEQFGEGKEQKVRDELAQDKVRQNPPGQTIVIPAGQVMCYDLYSGRYFMSTMEEIKQAQNSVNHMTLNYGHTTLSDLYDRLGLDKTRFADDVGWQSDQLLEIKFSTVMSDHDTPCIAIDYEVEPVRGLGRDPKDPISKMY